MNRFIKQVFIASALLSLTACVTDQKMKVRFEPMLPVPFLIVPDEGASSNSEQYTPSFLKQRDYQGDNYEGRQRYEDNN